MKSYYENKENLINSSAVIPLISSICILLIKKELLNELTSKNLFTIYEQLKRLYDWTRVVLVVLFL